MTSMIMRLSCALLGSLLLAACGDGPKKTEAPPPKVEGERIVFAAGSTQLGALVSALAASGKPLSLKLSGRIVWNEDRTVRVFPSFAGRVATILAKAGDTVKSGQPLATLASPDFGQAQADARRAASDFTLAERNLNRLRELYRNGVVAQKDLHAGEADFARAEAERDRASRRIALYGGTGATVDQQLPLRSPIGGVVVERNVNPGQEVRPDQMGSAPAMFVVTDPTRLWVLLDATERDLALLKAGRKMTLSTGAYPGESFDATIEVVSDFLDPATRTIKVRGSLANADRRLKGDMFANAEIATEGDAGLRIPVRAVFLSGNDNYVFVEEKPGQYLRTKVKTGPEQEGSVQIMSGLQSGQRVVVDGNLLLQEIYRSARKPAAS
jgi:cobalt-zinc-cadmium efflux system membrane fusion protein